jgi:hypothetical protein
MTRYSDALAALSHAGVRFVVIGVAGANFYARPGQPLFSTQDRDLFLPDDPQNLLTCWEVLHHAGWSLWTGEDPLVEPLDLWLAERAIAHRAAVRAVHAEGIEIDLTLVMAGFEFDEVWSNRQRFQVEGAEIPVARLRQIVESKEAAGRPKDLLFLATHEQTLREMLHREELAEPSPDDDS